VGYESSSDFEGGRKTTKCGALCAKGSRQEGIGIGADGNALGAPAQTVTKDTFFFHALFIMFSRDLLAELLLLGDGWEPSEIKYSQTAGTMVIVVTATEALLGELVCPYCNGREISYGDCGKKQVWRHVDGFCVKTLIECALPNARCSVCRHVFQVKPSWLGKSRHFTKGFEAFALSLLRETTVRSASRVLGISDQQLWRILFAYVKGVHGELSTVAISVLHREWSKTEGGLDRMRANRRQPPLEDDKAESVLHLLPREGELHPGVRGRK